MGLLLSRIWDTLSSLGSERSPSRILLLGLDNAGKTTVLYKLKVNETVATIPTIGFNVETVMPCPGVTFTVWDVGGQERLRALWKHYYQNASGLVYVVDSNDRERIAESRDELFNVLKHPDMTDVPVVIMANKQDLPNAMSTAEICDKIGVHQLGRQHAWHVQGCCALNAEGLYESFVEMSRLVKEFKKKQSSSSGW